MPEPGKLAGSISWKRAACCISRANCAAAAPGGICTTLTPTTLSSWSTISWRTSVCAMKRTPSRLARSRSGSVMRTPKPMGAELGGE
ncbi:hypothetical protein D3C78_1693250 [compost metagenome]